MFDDELLEVLCCPQTHQSVRFAETSVVARLNGLVAQGNLRNAAGQTVTEKFEGGLIRADGKILYPIRQNVHVMLAEQAIPLTQ